MQMLMALSITAPRDIAPGPDFISKMAEGVGFEPTMRLRRIAVFKTAPFNHSGTPPQLS